MKITKKYLQKVIKEEVENALAEISPGFSPLALGAAAAGGMKEAEAEKARDNYDRAVRSGIGKLIEKIKRHRPGKGVHADAEYVGKICQDRDLLNQGLDWDEIDLHPGDIAIPPSPPSLPCGAKCYAASFMWNIENRVMTIGTDGAPEPVRKEDFEVIPYDGPNEDAPTPAGWERGMTIVTKRTIRIRLCTLIHALERAMIVAPRNFAHQDEKESGIINPGHPDYR